MEIIQEIIEDLKFYSKMNLAPSSIELGPLAYREVCLACLVLRESGVEKLLGIPLKAIDTTNGWARGYKFKESNVSVYNL